MDRSADLQRARKRILDQIDAATGSDLASLSRELRLVTAELDSLAPPRRSLRDDLADRRRRRPGADAPNEAAGG